MLQVLLLVTAAVALPEVRERTDRLSLRAEVVTGTVALRGRGTDGVLRLRVHSDSRSEVQVRRAELTGPGLTARGVPPPVTVVPRGSAVLSIRYAASRCRAVGPSAQVRLDAVRSDGARGVLLVPVTDAVLAGCRPDVAPGVAVVGVRALGGDAVTGHGGRSASGSVVLEVLSAGAPVRLAAVSVEVAGAVFASPALAPDEPVLPAGARRELVVPFTVPFCPALRPRGRVNVVIRGDDQVLRVLGFSVAADGEARVARDVDLDQVLHACRAGGTTAP